MSDPSRTRWSRHPGLDQLLAKVSRKERLDLAEVQRLAELVQQLEAASKADGSRTASSTEAVRLSPSEPLLPGHATVAGVNRLAGRIGSGAEFLYRPAQDFQISSVGIGTHLGPQDFETDRHYVDAVCHAASGGINVLDTAINYREQRSERNVGVGLRNFLAAGGSRDEVVVCTKGGYLIPDAIDRSTLRRRDIVAGSHSIAPAFIADQLARSKVNLGVATVDVYYLHNPEIQLDHVGKTQFRSRLAAAFDYLEAAVREGSIRYYGLATWHGFRGGGLTLEMVDAIARSVAGKDHHFRFVQMPVNLGALEVLGSRHFDTASQLGVTTVASASLMRARLVTGLPDLIVKLLPGLQSDAQCSLQFVRSTPGISCALVGMRQTQHVRECVEVGKTPPLKKAQHDELVARLLSYLPST
ncbi:aldo/keto reductase [Streptomyces sp. C10-9-1]|uniref:aldo/keto reductase n=1 Tax=Streptomyces sp. C10-9-1 TaxID=1859285 RepID=UPI003F49BC7D